jgi:pimeloyl-ACP methyl ester carboxylesterase
MSGINQSPIVLLHGFPMDGRMWRHTVDHFSPRLRVIVPNAADLIANGATTAGMAAMALGALDAEAPGAPAVIVGLSMGGYVAAEFARAYPARLAALVMCDTTASGEPAESRGGRDAMIEAVRQHGVVHGTASLVAKLLHDPPPALASEVERIVREQEPAVIVACIEAIRDRRDNSDIMRHLSVPLLVLAGEHDVLAPQEVEEALAAMAPRGRFVVIPRSGHVPSLENPEAFNAALEEFLGVMSAE